MALRFIASCLLALCACGPEIPIVAPPVPPPPQPPAPAAALTLGTVAADGTFTPYDDGQDVTLVEGAQGGFHVWVTYRYAGATGGQVKLSRTAHRLGDDAIVLRTAAQTTAESQSMPLPMFMCPSPIGLSVIDQPIVFELELSDDDGVLARGAATLVPRCPDDNRDFCLRICTG